jgi:hypothetical protein
MNRKARKAMSIMARKLGGVALIIAGLRMLNDFATTISQGSPDWQAVILAAMAIALGGFIHWDAVN